MPIFMSMFIKTLQYVSQKLSIGAMAVWRIRRFLSIRKHKIRKLGYDRFDRIVPNATFFYKLKL